MAGFRTFATGEVLTAANVNNFLMSQSVMRFADADARTAALGADVVEGMLTYNLATDQLEVFDGTNFVVAAPEPPAGIGSNVVQTVKTDTFTSTSTSFVTITGLTATITPTTATSKILIIAQIAVGSDDSGAVYKITGGNTASYVGDAAGTRLRGVFGGFGQTALNRLVFSETSVFLDSPATTSATIYAVEASGTSSVPSIIVNRAASDGDSENRVRGASSITVIEVAP